MTTKLPAPHAPTVPIPEDEVEWRQLLTRQAQRGARRVPTRLDERPTECLRCGSPNIYQGDQSPTDRVGHRRWSCIMCGWDGYLVSPEAPLDGQRTAPRPMGRGRVVPLQP